MEHHAEGDAHNFSSCQRDVQNGSQLRPGMRRLRRARRPHEPGRVSATGTEERIAQTSCGAYHELLRTRSLTSGQECVVRLVNLSST